MFKILTSPPPPSLPRHRLARHTGWGEICYVRFCTRASETSGRRTGGTSTDSSLPLFNLTRQAALGTFQSIFKLTIYNQFSRGDGDGDEVEESPCCCGRCGAGWGVGEMGIQRRVVRGVSR